MAQAIILFAVLSFTSTLWATWDQSCPWERACEYRAKQGSLGQLMCGRNYRNAQSHGVQGEVILNEICNGQSDCIQTALKNFNATPTTIKNKQFSISAVFCGATQEQGVVRAQIYNPAVLDLMDKTVLVTKELSFYENGKLKSFTPASSEISVILKRGPQANSQNYTCVQDSYWMKWFEIDLYESGVVKRCAIPSNSKFETLYGEMIFANVTLFENGFVRSAYIPTNLKYPIKLGPKVYKISSDVLFHPNGKIKMASYLRDGTLYGVCLDDVGTVLKDDRIEKIYLCQ